MDEWRRNPRPLLIFCLIYGIALGQFLAPVALQEWWNRMGTNIPMNLIVMRILMLIESIILSIYISNSKRQRYCAASFPSLYLLLCAFLITVLIFVVTALFICFVYIAIFILAIMVLIFILTAGSCFYWFDRK